MINRWDEEWNSNRKRHKDDGYERRTKKETMTKKRKMREGRIKRKSKQRSHKWNLG